jgi:hypothetical protein
MTTDELVPARPGRRRLAPGRDAPTLLALNGVWYTYPCPCPRWEERTP